MVSFKSIACLSLAAAGALAGPVDKRSGMWHHKRTCMTDADAQQVADNYGELIRNYSDQLANEALTRDFVDYSEGVNTLINTCPQGDAAKPLPLLSPSFSNRQQFKVGQGQQPPIHFTQLGIWHTCDTVIVRWSSDNTAAIPNPRIVVGLIVMSTEQVGSSWKINEVFSEFDSGAWLQNLEEWGICTKSNAGSPTLAISGSPSGVPQTNSNTTPLVTSAAAPTGSASAPASYSAAPSGVSSSSSPSSYAASGASSAPVSSAASSWVASSQAPSATSYAASTYKA